jgi:hypothetical protein
MSDRKFPHYFKPVPPGAAHVDVYRLLLMFDVTDPCLGHAIKKLLVPGGRGTKDRSQDVAEAIVTLQRWQEIQAEDNPTKVVKASEPCTVTTGPYGPYCPYEAQGCPECAALIRDS